jgi:hypothetical protein
MRGFEALRSWGVCCTEGAGGVDRRNVPSCLCTKICNISCRARVALFHRCPLYRSHVTTCAGCSSGPFRVVCGPRCRMTCGRNDRLHKVIDLCVFKTRPSDNTIISLLPLQLASIEAPFHHPFRSCRICTNLVERPGRGWSVGVDSHRFAPLSRC